MNKEVLVVIADKVDKLEEAILTIAKRVDTLECAVMSIAKSIDIITKHIDEKEESCCKKKEEVISLADRNIKQLNQSCVLIDGQKFIVKQAYINGKITPLSNAVKHKGEVLGRFKD